MTDKTTNDTGEFLTERDTIEATLHVDDREFPIEVRDVTRDELEDIEDKSGDGPEAEEEAMREVIREYLVAPDVDPDEMMMRKRHLVWFGIQEAWSGVKDIQAAMDELELPGNRR